MAQKMKYNVLAIQYTEAGKDWEGKMQYTVSWKVVGKANDFEHAKRKFGGYPVIAPA